MTAPKKIIVGIDTGPSGRAALLWAADYARDHDMKLRAVHALDSAAKTPYVWSPGLVGMATAVREDTLDLEKSDVTALFNSVTPSPHWTLEMIETPSAGRLLVEEAEHADLLVIGTREHTGISRLLEGSVSHYCLSHAECPVVAVPAASARDLQPPSSVSADASSH